MMWIFVALAGYFFNALAGIFDKLLLSEGRIGSPVLYAFFTSLASIFVIVFLPFGFVLWNREAMFVSFASGAFFVFGLVALYDSVKRTEVSRAAPLVGMSTVGFIFLVALILQVGDGNLFEQRDIFALMLLLTGGLLLAKKQSGQCLECIRSIFTAGALLAVSLILLKESYQLSNFMSGFVWSRIGMFVTGLSFLLVPSFRRDIASRAEHISTPTKRNVSTSLFFFSNKILGGTGAFLIAYAVSLGSVTFVQALNGTQYAILFLLAIPLSMRYPDIFGESMDRREWFKRAAAIILLACGVALAATSGRLAGFL
jgi:glucose uptake protein GlcU